MKTYRILPALLLGVLTLSCSADKLPQQKLLENDKKINQIIAGMSLEEKVAMLHGKSIMSSEGIPRLGIQEMRYADGPFGIREEVGDGFRPLGWTTDSATYFPTGSALAATWSEELAYQYGHGMGVEGRLRGKDVILGPAINIQRLPVGGRTYEYLSEDPYLAARLAVSYTKGSQDAGTAVCIKHFAVNNQETNRGSVNVIIDERTLREIYLKPFEAAIREGGAMSVMTAYNKVNGYYCSENNHLNNEILRGEWGFNGFTVSDWGGTHSTKGAAEGGLDVQMPDKNFMGDALAEAVRNGEVDEKTVDEKVRNILRVRFAIKALADDECNQETTSKPEQQQIAYNVASKSIVLLKNDDAALPLNAEKVKSIAVIGQHAELSTAAGGVGAGVKAPYEITPLKGIQNKLTDYSISYAKGYEAGGRRGWGGSGRLGAQPSKPAVNQELLDEALALAGNSDLVIFVAGTGKSVESEGYDRSDIKLPNDQDQVLEQIAAVNPNIVTVIISGGPVDLNVVEKCSKAIVQGWWNGLESGNALADVLSGKISPSGKLPFTFPAKLEDSPAYALGNFPQRNDVQGDIFATQYRKDIEGQKEMSERPQGPTAYYTEKLLVGYRWFDTKQVKPMYAFGHGLSYASFEYSDFKVLKSSSKPDGVIKVSFNLKNTGAMDADEVAQLYVHRNDSKVEWPEKELKAFQRIGLKAGESKNVTLEIPVSELRYWNEETSAWTLEPGQLTLLLGSASDDIRQSASVEL